MVHEYSGFGDTAAEVRADHTRVTGTNDYSVRPVLVDGTWCGQIRVAYDTATGKPVDFASTEEWLRRDIVSACQISPKELATEEPAIESGRSNNPRPPRETYPRDPISLDRPPAAGI